MCGIAGFQGGFEEGGRLLQRMSAAVWHRGPDDQGHWSDRDAGVGLCQRRLSIIDLSPAGHQPMLSDDGNIVLVYNGELYNHPELRAELESSGAIFRGHSDTETILRLFERDGKSCLGRLNGIFALAIWDRQRRSLLLARDPMGVKPLYYVADSRGLLFASELKSILQDPEVSRDLDHEAVLDYLTYLWSPGERTMLRAAKKVMPGHLLEVEGGRVVRDEAFATLPFDQAIEPMGVQQAADQVREALRVAVRRQLLADVPVGSFLSGGLDSSAIVALARDEVPGGDIDCFTIDNRGEGEVEGFVDDLPYARKVAEHLGVTLHEIRVEPSIVDHLVAMIHHLDEPQADPAAIQTMLISSLAREHGIKVLLSGAGGDDLFTGYRRHLALMQESKWDWLPSAVRRGISAGSDHLPARPASLRKLSKLFAYADRDPDDRLMSYFRWVRPDVLSTLLSPELANVWRERAFCAPLATTLESCPGRGHPGLAGDERLNQMLAIEQSHFLVDHNLNYTDKMAMAMAVEVRVPFLDLDLVSLAARIPTALKQRGTTGKFVLKKAMEGILPEEVIYRPKTGFGAPLRQWMHSELEPMMNDLIGESSLAARGLFDPVGVARLRERDRSGQTDAAYTLFSLACIELWCRGFVDRVPELVAPVSIPHVPRSGVGA